MKPALKFATAVLALGGLLFQATSNATSLAEQPLKASVLAKPNVLFAMDDSGSMDAEVMIDGTFQGWFYGNYYNSPLYPSGKLRTGSASYDWNMFYLFPNGTGAGNKVYSDPSTAYGYAIPPTVQMAWVRSSDYNPLYYNPAKTYSPWSPAYTTSSQTYSNATPTAAKSHPALGSTTMNLTANQASTASDGKFTFTVGMTIPSGATNVSCYTGGAPSSLPHTVTNSRWMCKATVSYYPATYWMKESCTVDSSETSNCTTAWDGSTIKRYEIKSGNTFPSGRSYADELQNFANWFQYYRKRRLMLAAAMGGVLENMTGLRMGVVAFNSNSTPTMYDADNSTAANNARAVAGIFYRNEGSGGTPTRTTFAYIRNQFDTNTNIIQYACQRNAAFIITDGFANDGAVTPPTYSQSTYGSGVPYQSIASGSLADQALAYFTLPLRSSGAGALALDKVPLGDQTKTNPDPNDDLHVNTYAVTLGMKGTVWPANTNAFASPPTWPTPVSNTASMIDDLWHATINGRGQMYLANDVDSTIVGIQSGLSDIKSQEGAQSSVAVSSFNLLASDGQAYEASYNPAGWIGDLTASAVDINSGSIAGTPTWSAGTLLNARDWTTRVIFTSNGNLGGGLGFTEANVGATVNPDSGTYTNSGVVEYLRGNRTGEGTTYRTRGSLIGAVINAEPVVDIDTGVAYIASSEGMLHAFNTVTGAEEWAFVPNGALSSIGQTVMREYAFKTKLDGTPSIGSYGSSSKLLVAGMGAAGRSYYALDVSSPKSLSETDAANQVKWTFPSPSQSAYQPYVGYTVGRPWVVKSSSDGYVALVTSGYDNGYTIGDGKGRLWMLNASTGAVIREFVTTAGTNAAEAGLSQIAVYQEDDGSARYVYAGDLLGNLWKFDLNTGTTTLLAVLRDASGNPQPVMTSPQLTKINGKAVVMVGTGRLLDITDFGSTNVHTIYAVTDGDFLPNARSAMTALSHDTAAGTITGTVDWATKRGWFLDLPAGQNVNVDPKFVLGWLYVNANTAGGSNCAQSAFGYRIYVKSGTGTSETLSTTANATSPVLVQASEDALYRWIRMNDGGIDNKKIESTTVFNPRKNAWRDITR